MILPADFVSRTSELLEKEFTLFESSLQKETPTAIRVNTAKTRKTLNYERVPWCATGYYLPRRIPFTFDPLLHAGCYYVQEASSMFLEQAVRRYVAGPVKCLDLCAAPGGKSTHLAEVLPEGSLLVSNEVVRSRAHILAENLAKWGKAEVMVTNNNPEDFGRLTHFFDVMLADVPCSGEGMFRKDPDSIGQWSVNNVNLCAARQRKILQDAWDALKPGGILIYSTCTYNTEENEDNIHYITEHLGATPLPLPIPAEWKITEALKHSFPAYRFFPHLTKGEGFFLAVLRKNEAEAMPQKQASPKGKKEKSPLPPAQVRQWLAEPALFTIETTGATLRAIPAGRMEEYAYLSARLQTITAGITLGQVKGKDIIPSQSLALSRALNQESFNTCCLSLEEAIKYLRKETFPLPHDTPKGHALLTYKDHPLGFIKHLGNRFNNLYPPEWKIRTGYTPEAPAAGLEL